MNTLPVLEDEAVPLAPPPLEKGRVGVGIIFALDPHPTRFRASTSPFQGEGKGTGSDLRQAIEIRPQHVALQLADFLVAAGIEVLEVLVLGSLQITLAVANLALDLGLNGLANSHDGVDVLDLGLGVEYLSAFRANRDIGVAA